MSSSAARNFLALALLPAVVAGVAALDAPPPRALPLRRPVALVLAIDTGYYRELLRDPNCSAECLRLRTTLHTAVRDTLQNRYPFLDWNGPGAVDTIELTWRNGPGGVRSSQIVFQLRGAAASDSDRHNARFETRDDFRNRGEDAWKAESLRLAWLSRLPKALEKDLLPRVIGRVPLNATVVSLPPKRVIVSTNPDSIFAAEDVPPVFDVPVRVVYAPDGIDENGMVPLTNCNVSGKAGYSCLVEEIRFARSNKTGPGLDSVLQLGTLSWKGPRVREFVPRSRSASRPGSGVILPP